MEPVRENPGGAGVEKLGWVFARRACSNGEGVGGVAVIIGVLGVLPLLFRFPEIMIPIEEPEDGGELDNVFDISIIRRESCIGKC